MITLNSSISDLYETTVGHDILDLITLVTDIPENIFQQPLMKRITLQFLKKNIKEVRPDFYDILIKAVNSDESHYDMPITPKWWKEAVFYQIYPRTFYDANGDGIGDLPGIIKKLDYLKELGVNALWLSPIYDSPLDDNGYDIRDYYAIHKDLGTIADFKKLLEEAHKRDMKLIMDLVINHTSDEHSWFKQAVKDPGSKYRDYYFLYPQDSEDPPNNWTSFFSGSAWNKYEQEKLWGLHLFSPKQMDLNWDNPQLRQDIIAMINHYLDMGVDGFRMDVINFISKDEGLPDGDALIAELTGFTGVEHFFYGPHLHEYLREISHKAFRPHQAFSIGETPGLGLKMSRVISSEEREELDMVFNFNHLETPPHRRFEEYQYDLNFYKKYINEWMLQYGNDCWMALVYNNHDNPKMCSKIDHHHRYDSAIQRLLAVMQLTLKGTPFIYQGEEMGLTDYDFKSINDIHDVESLNLYHDLCRKIDAEKAFKIIKSGTRDHARVMLPWNKTNFSYQQKVNWQIYKTYQELIKLRKEHHALIYGDYKPLDLGKDRFIYSRADANETYIITCNLSMNIMKARQFKGSRLIYPKSVENNKTMGPYEARIYRIER